MDIPSSIVLDLPSTVALSVLTSLVASLVFLVGMRLLTPKIIISSKVSAYPTDEPPFDDRFRIKIVNARHRQLSDLSVAFYLERERSVPGGKVKVRTPIGSKFTTHSMPQKRFRDTEFDNARRIRIREDQLIQRWKESPDSDLVVVVFGRDSISGIGKQFEMHYELGADKFVRGSFPFGNSVDIVDMYQGPRPFELPKILADARESATPPPNA